MRKAFFASLLMTLMLTGIGRSAEMTTYINKRFGFSVTVPKTMKAMPAPADNVGRSFVDAVSGLEVRASGILNTTGRSALEHARANVPKGVTAETFFPVNAGNGLTLSWQTNGQAVRERVLQVSRQDQEIFFTVIVACPLDKLDGLLPSIEKILKSLRPAK